MDRNRQIEAREMALNANARRYARLRAAHIGIAHVLADSHSADAQALMQRAQDQIHVWEANKTCSPFYVRAWKRILRVPVERLRRLASEDRGGLQNALLQNTPFGFAMADARFKLQDD